MGKSSGVSGHTPYSPDSRCEDKAQVGQGEFIGI